MQEVNRQIACCVIQVPGDAKCREGLCQSGFWEKSAGAQRRSVRSERRTITSGNLVNVDHVRAAPTIIRSATVAFQSRISKSCEPLVRRLHPASTGFKRSFELSAGERHHIRLAQIRLELVARTICTSPQTSERTRPVCSRRYPAGSRRRLLCLELLRSRDDDPSSPQPRSYSVSPVSARRVPALLYHRLREGTRAPACRVGV